MEWGKVESVNEKTNRNIVPIVSWAKMTPVDTVTEWGEIARVGDRTNRTTLREGSH